MSLRTLTVTVVGADYQDMYKRLAPVVNSECDILEGKNSEIVDIRYEQSALIDTNYNKTFYVVANITYKKNVATV